MSKVYSNNNVSIGEIIYYQSSWSGDIIEAEITKIYEDGCSTKERNHVDKDGHILTRAFGEAGTSYQNMFSSAKEVYLAEKKKENDQIEAYCESIQTLKDLIEFPFHHCISRHSEEYFDKSARKAYEKRAQDLFYDREENLPLSR